MAILKDAHQLVAGGGLVLAFTVAEGTQAVVVGKKYHLLANQDCFIRFSASAVVGTDGNFDQFLPAGSAVILVATDDELRAIRDTADGTLGIGELDEP